MKKSFLCDYGDCPKEGDLPIVLTWRKLHDSERLRFCCLQHAAEWANRRLARGEAMEVA